MRTSEGIFEGSPAVTAVVVVLVDNDEPTAAADDTNAIDSGS